MPEPSPYAECPACGAVFRVPPALHDSPRVRCGQCQTPFALINAWVDEPWRTRAAAPEGLAHAPGAVLGAPDAPAGPSPRPAIPLRANTPVGLPPAGPSLGRVLANALVVGALLTVLAGQLLYFYRAPLADYPLARPWLERGCALIGCTLPAWRELDAWALEDARMLTHPDHPGALLASVVMVNRAAFAQPAPVLVLRLRDGTGKRVGARAFQPAEYLPPAQAYRPVAPGQALPVSLALADVAGARDFSFRLRW